MFDRLSRILTAIVLMSSNIILFAETVPSVIIKNCKIDIGYTVNSHREIMEKTWQDVCKALELPVTDVPGGEFCINPAGNPVYIQSGDICADGSFKIPINFGWCDEPTASCPTSSWILSDDKKTCFRPDDACWKDTENISEFKLLAAIVYGEASVNNIYEEMAGIASAVIRRRDAAKQKSVNLLIKKFPNFSYVIHDGNARYKKLLCSDETNEFDNAYKAAENALSYGEDYVNGGCFWDGADIKTGGVNHYRYMEGFHFTQLSHNIFLLKEPPPKQIKTKNGQYDYKYESTASYGKTIFWKLNNAFLKARGKKQCQ